MYCIHIRSPVYSTEYREKYSFSIENRVKYRVQYSMGPLLAPFLYFYHVPRFPPLTILKELPEELEPPHTHTHICIYVYIYIYIHIIICDPV